MAETFNFLSYKRKKKEERRKKKKRVIEVSKSLIWKLNELLQPLSLFRTNC